MNLREIFNFHLEIEWANAIKAKVFVRIKEIM